jgi:UTP:GlnB (protein PII) uridylyltransferase
MINFQYTKHAPNLFTVTLKTDHTRPGTFYKIATVIYYLGWDIVCAIIETIEENNKLYSYNVFELRTFEPDTMIHTSEIGIMLDSIFVTDSFIEDIYKQPKFVKPHVKNFFRERAELIFQDEPEHNLTQFYMEADSGRGLLFHVSKVLLDYEINIVRAKIDTDPLTERAVDTFYLQDKTGNMFGNTQIVKEIRRQILDQL